MLQLPSVVGPITERISICINLYHNNNPPGKKNLILFTSETVSPGFAQCLGAARYAGSFGGLTLVGLIAIALRAQVVTEVAAFIFSLPLTSPSSLPVVSPSTPVSDTCLFFPCPFLTLLSFSHFQWGS